MNPSEEDRTSELALSDVTKKLDQVIQWLAELDARIRALESSKAAIPAPPPPIPVTNLAANFPPPIPFPRQPLPAPPPPVPAAFVPPATPPPPRPALETTLGLNWINRIAVITLLLGAAFLFKYGVDNNWIGPGARVALGVVAGLAALISGSLLAKKNHHVFAQGITGLGLALLYLAFYAAAALYHVVDPGVAFFLMTATTVAAGALALKDNAQPIAVLGMIGGYLTPIALSTGEDHPWILFGYIFLLNLGGLVVARLRPWRVLEPLAFVATVAMYFGWTTEYWSIANRPVGTVFALAFYAQFAACQTRAIWWAVQLMAPLTLAGIWDQPTRFLPFEFLLAAGGLVVGQWRNWQEGPSWSLFCYWLPMWAWITMGRPGQDLPETSAFLTAGFLLFLIWVVGWMVIGKRPAEAGTLFGLAANPAAYFGTSYFLLNPMYHDWMGLFAALLGGLHLALSKLMWKDAPAEERDAFPGLITAGVALAFVTLAIPIQFAGFRVTIAWALEGLAVVWIWSRYRTLGSEVLAGVILTLSVLRLFSVDLLLYTRADEFQAFLNARCLAFVVCAVCLWLSAWLIKTGPGAGIAYVGGHVVMLTILGIEVVGIIRRGWPEGDQGSVITVAISILMASYAVLLVTGGVVVHEAIHRILGLILAGIVILKLYLLDVWVLGRGFRIAAFLGLGALLLTVSYLYSRFRPSVEKLWKD